MPKRIQLRRTKGWRKPADAIVVSRPSKWGNPFTVEAAIEAGYVQQDGPDARAFLVQCFKDWLANSPFGETWWMGPESDLRRDAILANIRELRGKDLCCWCAADRPCHADILLELANR